MRLSRRIRHWQSLAALMGMLALAALTGHSGSSPSASEHQAPPPRGGEDLAGAPSRLPSHLAGLRAAPPAVTDEPGVALEESRALDEEVWRERLSRSSEGLEVIQRPDGSGYVDLQDRFWTLSVARVDSAGEITTRCVSSASEAASALRDPSHRHAPRREQ